MRILLTSVPAGSGHVKAAEAVEAAIRLRAPGVEVQHIQVTDLVVPGFRRLYVDGYRLTVDHAPQWWGRLYRFLDEQPTHSGITPLLCQTQRLLSPRFYDYVDRYRPDLILTTHFLIPQLLSARRQGAPQTPVETIITDYDVHRFWVSDRVSRYYVAHEDMREVLSTYGVPRDHVAVTGIPVHPRFLAPVQRRPVLNAIGLDPEQPAILVLAGGLGLRQLKLAVEELFHLKSPVQIITVSGKNTFLYDQMSALVPPPHIRLSNLGYVDNMHELLSVSDVVITKPGGLTVSECLAKKKMMILFSPIPGQEENNALFLSRHKAAAWANTLAELPQLAEALLSQRSVQGALLWNEERCARPQAAFDIAQAILKVHQMAA